MFSFVILRLDPVGTLEKQCYFGWGQAGLRFYNPMCDYEMKRTALHIIWAWEAWRICNNAVCLKSWGNLRRNIIYNFIRPSQVRISLSRCIICLTKSKISRKFQEHPIRVLSFWQFVIGFSRKGIFLSLNRSSRLPFISQMRHWLIVFGRSGYNK